MTTAQHSGDVGTSASLSHKNQEPNERIDLDVARFRFEMKFVSLWERCASKQNSFRPRLGVCWFSVG